MFYNSFVALRCNALFRLFYEVLFPCLGLHWVVHIYLFCLLYSEMVERKKDDPRASRILELESEGKSRKEIAVILDVDESTIYRIKQRPTYIGLLEVNRSKYEVLLDEMSESDQYTSRLEALKERGRLDRAGSKIMADYVARHEEALKLTPEQVAEKLREDRAVKEHFWFNVVQIQPWQDQRVYLHFSGKEYSHIGPDWKPVDSSMKVSDHRQASVEEV